MLPTESIARIKALADTLRQAADELEGLMPDAGGGMIIEWKADSGKSDIG